MNIAFRGKRDAKMDSSDDCFEDVDEPLYGYVVNLQLKQEEPCDLRQGLLYRWIEYSADFSFLNYHWGREKGPQITP